MTQLEGFCTLFFVLVCRTSGSTPAYSAPDSSYAATLHALTTVIPDIPATSSHKTLSVYQGGIYSPTKKMENKEINDLSQKHTDNKLIIKIRKYTFLHRATLHLELCFAHTCDFSFPASVA